MTASPLFLGIDLGTSGLKAGVFDLQGECRGTARVKYPTHETSDAFEQNADDWWRALQSALRSLAAECQLDEVEAIAIGGHAPSPAFLGPDGKPVAPVTPWMNRRTEDQRGTLLQSLGRAPHTGDERLLTHVGARWMYLRERAPEQAERVTCIMQSGDFLIARLTGSPVTTTPPDSDVFAAAGLPAELWPTAVRRPGAIAGTLLTAISDATGMRPSIPVVCGGLDSFLSAIGSGMRSVGDACINVGSSAVVSLLVDADSSARFHWGGRQILSQPVWVDESASEHEVAQRWSQLLKALRETLAHMCERHDLVPRVRCVGGGAQNPDIVQTLANALDRTVEVPVHAAAGTVGAAVLAASALDYGTPIDISAQMVRMGQGYEPSRRETESGASRKLTTATT